MNRRDTGRRYPDETKRRAVKMAREEGRGGITRVAKQLGCMEQTLSNWMNDPRYQPTNGVPKGEKPTSLASLFKAAAALTEQLAGIKQSIKQHPDFQ